METFFYCFGIGFIAYKIHFLSLKMVVLSTNFTTFFDRAKKKSATLTETSSDRDAGYLKLILFDEYGGLKSVTSIERKCYHDYRVTECGFLGDDYKCVKCGHETDSFPKDGGDCYAR